MMNSGAGAPPDLPADIISDILSRLPVRSLCQLRCVSKQFLSLISNPNFVKLHFDRNNKNKQQPEKLFLFSKTSDCYSLDLKSPNFTISRMKFGSEQNRIQFTKVWGSCDGLLLLSNECLSLFIANPSTRECRELPCSSFFVDSATAYDKYGFGFDSSCNDYKVVRISYKIFENVFSVYDKRAGSWRGINSCPYEIFPDPNPEGVYLNGALHWLGGRNVGFITLDLSNEKFSDLPFPSFTRENFRLEWLGVIQGCLSGADFFCKVYDPVDFWVMKEYGVGDSWIRFTIDSSPIIYSLLPLRTGKVLLNVGTRLVSYNPEEGEYEGLEVKGFPPDFVAVAYEESLLQSQERD